MAVLGLRFCARAFSSCGKRGLLFIAVCGPLTVVASPVAEHMLQTHRLSNCGSGAQLLHSMWDLPRPGLEPVSPALAGRFSSTEPPRKPSFLIFFPYVHHISMHLMKQYQSPPQFQCIWHPLPCLFFKSPFLFIYLLWHITTYCNCLFYVSSPSPAPVYLEFIKVRLCFKSDIY